MTSHTSHQHPTAKSSIISDVCGMWGMWGMWATLAGARGFPSGVRNIPHIPHIPQHIDINNIIRVGCWWDEWDVVHRQDVSKSFGYMSDPHQVFVVLRLIYLISIR